MGLFDFLLGKQSATPSRKELPVIPEGYGYRIAVLPVTATRRDVEEGSGERGFITTVIVAETREELEAIKGAQLYSKRQAKRRQAAATSRLPFGSRPPRQMRPATSSKPATL